MAIDELVADSIEMEYNEPNDETVPDLQKLRERLKRCMAMVDEELARREGRSGDAFSS